MVKEKEPLFVVGLAKLLHKKFYYCGRNMLQKINETHNLIAFATTRQNSKISDWVAWALVPLKTMSTPPRHLLGTY